LELLRAIKAGKQEFTPAAMTDAEIIAFDPVGERLLALRERGLIDAPEEWILQNRETLRGRFGKIVVRGLTTEGRRVIEALETGGVNEQTRAIVRERIVRADLQDRRQTFQHAFDAIVQDYGRRNFLTSGPFLAAADRCIGQEFRDRAQLAVNRWLAVVEAQKLLMTPPLEGIILEEIDAILREHCPDLESTYARATTISGGSLQHIASLEELRSEVLRTMLLWATRVRQADGSWLLRDYPCAG